MKLVFISDKVCWPDESSPTAYATVGGFPFQMNTISYLFDQTRIVIMERKQPAPPNLMPLIGYNLSVHPIKEPPGENWTRKISILPWLIINGGTLWQEIVQADVLHINVPGDLGGIAILLGLFQKKKMFIRHCGTWDQPATVANRALLWLLERIANNKTVLVMATGGDVSSPSRKNPHIAWIFSTTLSQPELDSLPIAQVWTPNSHLRLITVCRLSESKNVQAVIRSLPLLIGERLDVHLDVLGAGEFRPTLEGLTDALGLTGRVTFHGNVNHDSVLKALSGSHLFVFPTQVKEGFPKAVLEAMACGLPVIATQVSVIPHLLRNGCGLLLQDTSASAVAQAVINMTSDLARMARMGELARHAIQGYTLEAWGREIQMHLEGAWGPLRSSAD